MKCLKFVITFLFITCIIEYVTGQESDPGKEIVMEEIRSQDLPPESSDSFSDNNKKETGSNLSSSTAKPLFDKPRQTNYTEPRFASLFNSKSRRPRLPPVKHTTRAKPTLPPFIKSPPSVKVTTEEPVVTRASRTARTTTRPTARTTTSATRRNRGRDSASNIVSTTESSRKGRRFGSDMNPRNSTRIRTRN